MQFPIRVADATSQIAGKLTLAAVTLTAIAGFTLAPGLAAAQPPGGGHVCIPDEDWCYDLNGGGGGPMGTGGSGSSGSGSGSSGSGSAGSGAIGSGPSSSGSNSTGPSGGNSGYFDQQHYDQCMARRDVFCDAAGVVGTLEYGPAGGFVIRQTCRLAYKEVCQSDASKP